MERAGHENPALLFKSSAELHVVQRAAPPAREPSPVAVDVIARAIMPACVEQPVMMSSATGLSAFGIVLFHAGATFFARLLTCHFVSHNCCPFVCGPVSLRPHITWCGSESFILVNSRCPKQAPVFCRPDSDEDLSCATKLSRLQKNSGPKRAQNRAAVTACLWRTKNGD